MKSILAVILALGATALFAADPVTLTLKEALKPCRIRRARHDSGPRSRAAIKHIVLHSTEGGTAESVARFFATTALTRRMSPASPLLRTHSHPTLKRRPSAETKRYCS